MICYTDGSCSGNPGPGGFGVVVLDNNEKPITEKQAIKKKLIHNLIELVI